MFMPMPMPIPTLSHSHAHTIPTQSSMSSLLHPLPNPSMSTYPGSYLYTHSPSSIRSPPTIGLQSVCLTGQMSECLTACLPIRLTASPPVCPPARCLRPGSSPVHLLWREQAPGGEATHCAALHCHPRHLAVGRLLLSDLARTKPSQPPRRSRFLSGDPYHESHMHILVRHCRQKGRLP